jgi:hypothetical protein
MGFIRMTVVHAASDPTVSARRILIALRLLNPDERCIPPAAFKNATRMVRLVAHASNLSSQPSEIIHAMAANGFKPRAIELYLHACFAEDAARYPELDRLPLPAPADSPAVAFGKALVVLGMAA